METAQLPDDFLSFLRESNIDMKHYEMLGKLPRYIRVVKGETIDVKKYYPSAEAVAEAPGVWRLPHDVKLHGTEPYDSSRIAGMDLGSYMAVTALQIQPTDTVLDICCAPGAKLLLTSELTNNHITGLDNNLYRLSACKSTLAKYNRNDIRLILCDATTYDYSGMSVPWWVDDKPLCANNPAKHRKLLGKSYPNTPTTAPPAGIAICDYGKTRGQRPPVISTNYKNYDKVIVDAECTTDGSLRHVEKLIRSGKDWKERSAWAASGSTEVLFSLQKKLLRKGIELAKPGGIIVYSTCSLSSKQNEEVVREVLLDNTVTQVHPFGKANSTPPYETSKSLPLSLIFTPATSNCGALFVSKFMKNICPGPELSSGKIKRLKTDDEDG